MTAGVGVGGERQVVHDHCPLLPQPPTPSGCSQEGPAPLLWGQGALAQETRTNSCPAWCPEHRTSKGLDPALDLPAKGGPSPGVCLGPDRSQTD